MRRLFTARAEIVRRLHDPFAEMILPDAVDHDASGQRIIRVGDPTGEEFAPAPAMIFRNILPAENRQKAARDFIAQTLRITLAMDARVGRRSLDDGVSLGDLDVARVQFRLAQPDA